MRAIFPDEDESSTRQTGARCSETAAEQRLQPNPQHHTATSLSGARSAEATQAGAQHPAAENTGQTHDVTAAALGADSSVRDAFRNRHAPDKEHSHPVHGARVSVHGTSSDIGDSHTTSRLAQHVPHNGAQTPADSAQDHLLYYEGEALPLAGVQDEQHERDMVHKNDEYREFVLFYV